MKIAVITGASSGLGQEFLKIVSEKYPELDEIWLIARRKDCMDACAARLNCKNVRTFSADLTNEKCIEEVKTLIDNLKPEIRILINNAGFGKLGYVDSLSYEDQMRMIDLNCRAMTALTCISLPYMAQGKSFIINTCSIAAFAPNARLTVYSSTKAYVYSFSKGLRYELKRKKINVLAVCPGPMDTEFMSVAGIGKGDSATFDMLPWCKPHAVALGAINAAERGAGVFTNKIFYKFYHVVAKILPHSIVMQLCKA